MNENYCGSSGPIWQRGSCDVEGLLSWKLNVLDAQLSVVVEMEVYPFNRVGLNREGPR